MLWIKAFHLIAMAVWFSGLFYLPRLFVYHANCNDKEMNKRFLQMERKLYYYVTTPGAILTTVLGISLIFLNWSYYSNAIWLHLKLGLVLGLFIYHVYLGRLFQTFAKDCNQRNGDFYRCINEIPTVFLIAIVILVTVKPI